MKKVLIFFGLIISSFASAQSFYYITPFPIFKCKLGFFNASTCEDSTIGIFNVFDLLGIVDPTDLAIHPDGTYYAVAPSGSSSQLVRLNTTTGQIEFVKDLPVANITSLTCDQNGIIYAAYDKLVSYNPQTDQVILYGSFPPGVQAAGDLTFREGKLYMIAYGNGIYEVNINNPAASTLTAQLNVPASVNFYGIVTFIADCENFTTLATNSDGVYDLDFTSGDVNQLCSLPFEVYGAATVNEFAASQCYLDLDLDFDNSSGADSLDYQSPVMCSTPVLLAVADSDAVFRSGYSPDSLHILLIGPTPDGADEYLTATAIPEVGVQGQNTNFLTLINDTGATTDSAFQKVLLTARYHNTATPPTPGQRVVAVTAFVGNRQSDTAFAFLVIPLLTDAGRDTSFSLCADAPALNLSILLAPGATPGGQWMPGTGFFDPQITPSGVFTYVAGNGGVCPADTALITANVEPLPVFLLGGDTSLCAGDILSLSTPFSVSWQDGTIGTAFQASGSGLYWAQAVSAVGCTWRDSLLLTINQPVTIQSFGQACFGQTYEWNGLAVSSDTTLCITLPAFNGCDSTHCHSVTFFYAALAFDTSLCAGETLQWLGQSLSTSGIYKDTVPISGCLTTTTLTLSVFPTVQTTLSATLCAGETYDFHNTPLAVPGIYADTFPSITGCDSIVTLTLTILPVPAPAVMGEAVVCPGAGSTLSVAGNYVDYAWSTGATSAALYDALPGLYQVTVTDSAGCTGIDSFSVVALLPVEAEWESSGPLCPGDSTGWIELVQLSGGMPPFLFQISGGPATSEALFDGLTKGNWTVIGTDSMGCVSVWEFMLDEPPAWAVSLGPDVTLQQGEDYVVPLILSLPGNYSFTWAPPVGLSCIDCPQPNASPAASSTTYFVTVTDSNGCTATDALAIRVSKGLGLYTPNAFTPDGDGTNDVFTIFGDTTIVDQIILFQVFDRWGSLVFEEKNIAPNDTYHGWDGTCRGRELPSEVFVWQAEIRLLNGALVRRKGDLMLLR